jgi:hypothetical protein
VARGPERKKMKTKPRQIKKPAENRKRKEKNEVAKLLLNVQKNAVDTDLANELPLRMSEMDSFIQVIHAALESDLHDESFYRKHVGQIMYLFEKRFDELQILVGALVDKEWAARKKAAKIVA